MNKILEGKLRVFKVAEGPVTVVYRQEDGLYYCTALEFDLVGTGETREAAFEELQTLVKLHLEEYIRSRGEMVLYNPSDREEWDNRDKERYDVSVVLLVSPRQRRPIPTSKSVHMKDIRSLRQAVQEFELTPLCSCG